MYINISEFVQNANELIFNHSGSCKVDGLDDGAKLTKDVDFTLMISKVDTELILNLYIEFDYIKPCDRCLAEVNNNQFASYSAKLVNDLTFDQEKSTIDDIVVMDQYKIDICDLVKELVILSIPMKNLCSEDCLGICLGCGKNLNEGKCDCDTENIDFRFSVLKDFKIDEEV